jgi:hypothetical protein
VSRNNQNSLLERQSTVRLESQVYDKSGIFEDWPGFGAIFSLFLPDSREKLASETLPCSAAPKRARISGPGQNSICFPVSSGKTGKAPPVQRIGYQRLETSANGVPAQPTLPFKRG